MRKAVRSESKRFELALYCALSVAALAAAVAPRLVLAVTPPCLFDFAGFKHCWGCGMTHAILACLHGEIHAAWTANPRVFIVLPLLLVEYLRLGLRVFEALRARPLAIMP